MIKRTGISYRLVAKKSVVNQVQAQVGVIKACLDAALMNKGMYEPPPNVAPDMFIEVGYGVDITPQIDAAARGTFLQLFGRLNPAPSIDSWRGAADLGVHVAGL